jgi:hypothetical protein
VRYSFTGPSRLDAADEAAARAAVAELAAPTEITTGAASGWDTVACLAALEAWPDALHRIVTPGARFNLEGVNEAIETAKRLRLERFEVVTLPAPSKGGASQAYRERNTILVIFADVLVAGVRVADDGEAPRFYRSGEWATANLAARAGRRVDFVRLAVVR